MIEVVQTEAIESAVENHRLQALVHYWDAVRGANAMPSRHQIDPIQISALLPFVLIANVTATGARIRLLGTNATDAYGRETRGKWVREFELGEFTPIWLEAFELVISSGLSASARGTFRNAIELCGIEMVLMPLSDNGLSISHIFGGLLIKTFEHGRSTRQKEPITYIALAQSRPTTYGSADSQKRHLKRA